VEIKFNGAIIILNSYLIALKIKIILYFVVKNICTLTIKYLDLIFMQINQIAVES